MLIQLGELGYPLSCAAVMVILPDADAEVAGRSAVLKQMLCHAIEHVNIIPGIGNAVSRAVTAEAAEEGDGFREFILLIRV